MTEPAAGILLIAEPFLKDPSFARSVVLICRHNEEEGTFGFVLSRQLELSLDEIMNDLDGWELPVFNGGPVSPDTLHYLHRYPDLFPDAVNIIDDVYWGGDFEKLKELLKAGVVEPENIKFFLGFSGWMPAQLDEEMKENTWLTVEGNSKIIFDTDHEEIWNASLLKLGGSYKMMINFPTDPQLN